TLVHWGLNKCAIYSRVFCLLTHFKKCAELVYNSDVYRNRSYANFFK
ncbi:hypothetical protein M23134_07166, partial [Microscilla marina ATCC 23134]